MREAIKLVAGQIREHLTLRDLHKPFKLLVPYLRGHWKPHAGLFLIVLVEIALTLTTSWYMGAVTDAALHQQLEKLFKLLPFAVLLVLTSISLGYTANHLELLASTRLKKQFQENLVSHLLRLPAAWTNRSRTGELMTLFSQDLHGIDGMIGKSLIQLIRLPLIFIAVMIYMLHIHWMLALLSLAAAPVVAVGGAIFGMLMRNNSRRMYDQVGEMNCLLHELMQGLALIRSFTLEKRLYLSFFGKSEELYVLERKDAKLRGVYAAVSEAGSSAMFLTCLSLGAYFVTTGIISVGALVSFLNLTAHLVYPLTGLAGLWVGYQKAIPAIERLERVLQEVPESSELPEPMPAASGGASIRFEQVTFAYDGQSKLFEQFQLHIEAGKTVAIVGESGAGKSTLFQLLQRFYRPHSGRIYMNGVPIEQLSAAQLRSSIAHVAQETFLFAGSIRDNLLLARADVTDEEMMQAAKDAYIHDFIMTLPSGYDTEVGERGVRLSGGQKQRVAIARALLKQASVLLLDEATSALDSESEYQVKQTLERLGTARTTLIIAHRLSTVLHADLIIVLREGAIVQMGTHQELIACEGVYRRLVRRQYFDQPGHVSLV
ncbi:ABC transporter ATP-binding protein [Paenibacillus sp. YYML68]|uniref:ABC transporter ATP-binding protein n=1 Tax=Paenibacillus sp. YYML68 TaxID=2909250 RepID=UPI0024919EA3|nr:ABC transporter ATP-binding protein [Paenibacillus sp. YYML68]